MAVTRLRPAQIAVSAADRIIGSTTAAGASEEIPCTAFVRTVLDDVDAAAVRTTLGITGGSTPTGTGLRKVVSGVEAGAAATLVNADVDAAAAIAESKLSLATDAAAGTGSRRTLGSSSTSACAGNDSRLSDARSPNGTAGGDLNGTYPNPKVAAIAEYLVLSSTIAPASLGSSQNDWAPSGISTCTGINVQASTTVDITGIGGGIIGKVLILTNIGGNVITLKHYNSGSSAANRFYFANAGNVRLFRGTSIILKYGLGNLWYSLTAAEAGVTTGSPGTVILDGSATHYLKGDGSMGDTADFEQVVNRGAANGYAALDGYAMVPINNLPIFVIRATLSSATVNVSATPVDLTDSSTKIWIQRVTPSARSGHLSYVINSASDLDVNSDDISGSDDSDIDVFMMGSPTF